jgi:hypothetical protein
MTIVLLAVGLLATAAGLVTIGFGIPINAFSLGNTLIVAGTISVGSGLILIALSLVIGQLKRIAEALKSQPQPQPIRAESTEALATPRAGMTPGVQPAPRAPATAQMPEMPEPAMPELEPMRAAEPPRVPEPRVAEPDFPVTAVEAPGPLDWLRSKSKSAPATPASPAPPVVEPPMVEVVDEAPLSPRTPQRPAMPPAEPANEPKIWSPAREPGTIETRSAPRVEQPMPRATPQVETPKDKDRFGFDLVWPDRSAAAPAAEPIKREPALDMPMPPVPARPRESRPIAEKRAEPAPRKPVERGPAILKSGVIDGMPYTLYADGSIEAQLPQGTVKFASVDALRTHLEKQT